MKYVFDPRSRGRALDGEHRGSEGTRGSDGADVMGWGNMNIMKRNTMRETRTHTIK